MKIIEYKEGKIQALQFFGMLLIAPAAFFSIYCSTGSATLFLILFALSASPSLAIVFWCNRKMISYSAAMNSQFITQLQEQYGATSEKSYTRIKSEEAHLSFFSRDGKETLVATRFFGNGEISFYDLNGNSYEPITTS